jgi:hypothetical protein
VIAEEWLFWIFTFGQKTPSFLRSHTIRYVTEKRTFSIEKVKQRLGYVPVDDRKTCIEEGVAWEIKRFAKIGKGVLHKLAKECFNILQKH